MKYLLKTQLQFTYYWALMTSKQQSMWLLALAVPLGRAPSNSQKCAVQMGAAGVRLLLRRARPLPGASQVSVSHRQCDGISVATTLIRLLGTSSTRKLATTVRIVTSDQQ